METEAGLVLVTATKDVNLGIVKAVAMVVVAVSITIVITAAEGAVPMAVELAPVGPFSEVLVEEEEALVVHLSLLIALLTRGPITINMVPIGLRTLIVVDIVEMVETTMEVMMDIKEAILAVVVEAMRITAVRDTATIQLVREDDTNKLGTRLADHRLLNSLLLGKDSITEAFKMTVSIL